jgi:hypothetical protein
MPITIKLPLSKLARIPGMKTVGKAVNAGGAAWDKFDHAFDAANAPIRTARVKACTVECDAELTGMADRPAVGSDTVGAGYDVLLLRLRVARHEGTVECCVQQSVPIEQKCVLAPGARLKVLAHESDPGIAIVKWDEAFKPIGDIPKPMAEVFQFAWPDREDWPAEGAIEIRDDGRYRRKLAERRTTWASAGARLAGGKDTGSRTNDRADWKLDLQLDDGRQVKVKERVPHLLIARLVHHHITYLAPGIVDTVTYTVRAGAPIAVLVSPKGEVAVDWEATMRYPELRNPSAQ